MNPKQVRPRWVILSLLFVFVCVGIIYALGLNRRAEPEPINAANTSGVASDLDAHCREIIGEPRIERVGEQIFVAVGYDLANSILIRTDAGGVLVDTSMSPKRAEVVREALLDASPGPITDIVLTHSHIDHIGGTSAWVSPEPVRPAIWATADFTDHFFKQYGVFREAESARGSRQFGRHVPSADLPCSALGRLLDFDATLDMGVMLPTRTFGGSTSFSRGGLTFELVEAHGETHDQLFVWIPELEALLPGDNWYLTFPNLYTIRGTSPRPVDQWIQSIDRMRALQPQFLVPSHTPPLRGREKIRTELTGYRDAIQWVHDQTVRLANQGMSVDEIAHAIELPAELGGFRSLLELYGQIDWSVRAIYSNELGWFDGDAGDLYPLAPSDAAARTIELMGGVEAIRQAGAEANESGEFEWALHLLTILKDANIDESQWQDAYVVALRGLASTTANSNGRGYLLETALELEGDIHPLGRPTLTDDMVAHIPLAQLFSTMAIRLDPTKTEGVHESVAFVLSDADGSEEKFVITVRNRIAEVVQGESLPGTPEPIATVRASAQTWRDIALDRRSTIDVVTSGDLKIDGDLLGFRTFIGRFQRGL